MKRITNIVCVRLEEPYDGQTDYFGSLATIYDTISKDAVGIGYWELRNTFAKADYRLDSGKVEIKNCRLIRKEQKRDG